MTDTPAPPWWGDVSSHYGALSGIALDHPGKGLTNALNGDYHANNGDTHGGLAQWVDDHPPGEPGA